MPASLTGQDDGKPAEDLEDVKGAEPGEGDGKSAEPSDAEGKDEGPKSVFDAVKAALEPKEGEGSSPSEGSEDQGDAKSKEKSEDDEAELGEPTDEELAGYHSKTRRRMKWLLGKRQEAVAERDALKPAADGWNQLQGYMGEANLSSEEVNQGFEIMRLMKNEPRKALDALLPYVHQLQQVVGDILPNDLRQRVEAGDLSEQDARDLSRARSSATLADATARQAMDNARRLQEQQGLERHATAVTQAVDQWDAQQRKTDPDYLLKRDRVMEKVKLALHEQGFPKTTQAAVEMAAAAKKAVDEELKKFAPKRQEIKPVKPGSGSATAARQPTSLLDAMKAAVGD